MKEIAHRKAVRQGLISVGVGGWEMYPSEFMVEGAARNSNLIQINLKCW